MSLALPVIRVLLGLALLIAGAAKLADLPGSRAALEGFGLPPHLARPVGTVLPAAEIAVAALLAFNATARAGAVGALALLLAFSAGIAAAIQRGERPECHCAGQLHSEPAGPRALVRNLSLAGLAAIAAFASA